MSYLWLFLVRGFVGCTTFVRLGLNTTVPWTHQPWTMLVMAYAAVCGSPPPVPVWCACSPYHGRRLARSVFFSDGGEFCLFLCLLNQFFPQDWWHLAKSFLWWVCIIVPYHIFYIVVHRVVFFSNTFMVLENPGLWYLVATKARIISYCSSMFCIYHDALMRIVATNKHD